MYDLSFAFVQRYLTFLLLDQNGYCFFLRQRLITLLFVVQKWLFASFALTLRLINVPFCLIKKEPKNQSASLGRPRIALLSGPLELIASCSFPHSRNAIPLNSLFEPLKRTTHVIVLGDKRQHYSFFRITHARFRSMRDPRRGRHQESEKRATLISYFSLICSSKLGNELKKRNPDDCRGVFLILVGNTGFEPVTPTLSRWCSKPTELITQGCKYKRSAQLWFHNS